ncbi:hypothetical protein F4810DRAFT_405755 [Camillea tinctor]|nr:hypothetical protein F4810DRAFT_405755 [Camillea tinctor]
MFTLATLTRALTVAVPGLASALALASLAGATHHSAADAGYAWTFTWTGPKTCDKVPCSYSYDVSGPRYTAPGNVEIPPFSTSCSGSVDEALAWCGADAETSSGEPAVAGNFSTYETSGVGAGEISVAVSWVDGGSTKYFTLTAATPLQASAGTWTAYPTGCPLASGCVEDEVAANGTSTRRRRHRQHRTLAEWWKGY